MFPQKRQNIAEVDPKTYPLGEQIERTSDGSAQALVALNHTPVERRLYAAMLGALDSPLNPSLNENAKSDVARDVFTVRRVMELTDITNLSTVRRGLEALVAKSSAERVGKPNGVTRPNGDGQGTGNGAATGDGGNGGRDHGVAYRVRLPEDVIASGDESGAHAFTHGFTRGASSRSFDRVIQRIVATKNLSRREAQVALCCVEGLTNAEIGSRLLVKEQTVKFHLRHVFLKFGVKRRAELISRLLL
ncbi:MAG: helix-turn-helix transcriptional regulator [Pyrinomonadaceae bacterium]|nr:helix-turn-helix transcriptional regulator [Pyrinomonadaceae bacterium]